jgi:hypothetical protein
MKIFYNSLIPVKGFCAMFFCGKIYARKEFKPLSKYIINHEEIHQAQCKDMGGWVPYYASYLLENTKHGYRGNCYEREAYSKMYDLNYLATRKPRAWETIVDNQNGFFESLAQIAKRLFKQEAEKAKKSAIEALEEEAIKIITGDEKVSTSRHIVKLKVATTGNGNGVQVNGQTAQKPKKVQPKAKAQKELLNVINTGIATIEDKGNRPYRNKAKQI